MPRTRTALSQLLPREIAIDVRVYNEAHRKLLANLAVWPMMQEFIKEPVTVPAAQFLVYSLFRNRDTSTLDDLRRVASSRSDVLDLVLARTPDSFAAKPTLVAGEHRAESQDIGEALGLCVMDKIFETHEGDWQRIPEGHDKTLDYVASDQSRHLELEAKGSFVEDRTAKSSSISQHRASVEAKKSDSTGVPGGVRIGTIAAIDRETDGRPLVWLLDPPVHIRERTPRATRLIHRLDFIRGALELVNPSSALVAALGTRVLDLRGLQDPFVLDGTPLGIPPRDEARVPGARHRFFATRSVVSDGPAGGVVVTAGKINLFFAGVRERLVELAESQNFDALMNYAEQPGIVAKEVIAVISKGRFLRDGLNPESRSVRIRRSGYFEIRLRGDLAYSSGGLVFGWLDRPEDL